MMERPPPATRTPRTTALQPAQLLILVEQARAVAASCSLSRGACLQPAISTDNLPYCARRASGSEEYVDSLLTLSAPIGANYTGEWDDGSTFVVTVTVPFPDAEYAPRPFDTMLKIPAEAGITNVAETAPPLELGPGLLGVAYRYETLPTPPGAPESLHVKVDGCKATATWCAPDDGGLRITKSAGAVNHRASGTPGVELFMVHEVGAHSVPTLLQIGIEGSAQDRYGSGKPNHSLQHALEHIR